MVCHGSTRAMCKEESDHGLQASHVPKAVHDVYRAFSMYEKSVTGASYKTPFDKGKGRGKSLVHPSYLPPLSLSLKDILDILFKLAWLGTWVGSAANL